jgi:hypothetical protein
MGWWLRRGFRDGHVGSHKELWWIVREVVVWAALKSNFAGVTDAEGIRSASDLVLFERASAVVSRRRDAYRKQSDHQASALLTVGGRRGLYSKAGSRWIG